MTNRLTAGMRNPMSEKHDAKTPAADSPPVDDTVHSNLEKGTVADTRRAPMVDSVKLWQPPSPYVPLDAEAIRGLSKIADDQQAELALAKDEIVRQTPTMKSRFGEAAPDTTQVSALWQRYQDANTGWAIAKASQAYFGDVAQVALHDLLQIVEMVDELARPVANRNPGAGKDFASVLKISDQRGNMVRQGKARKQAEKQAIAEATETAPPRSKP
jgi:hypothetical protein